MRQGPEMGRSSASRSVVINACDINPVAQRGMRLILVSLTPQEADSLLGYRGTSSWERSCA